MQMWKSVEGLLDHCADTYVKLTFHLHNCRAPELYVGNFLTVLKFEKIFTDTHAKQFVCKHLNKRYFCEFLWINSLTQGNFSYRSQSKAVVLIKMCVFGVLGFDERVFDYCVLFLPSCNSCVWFCVFVSALTPPTHTWSLSLCTSVGDLVRWVGFSSSIQQYPLSVLALLKLLHQTKNQKVHTGNWGLYTV